MKRTTQTLANPVLNTNTTHPENCSEEEEKKNIQLYSCLTGMLRAIVKSHVVMGNAASPKRAECQQHIKLCLPQFLEEFVLAKRELPSLTELWHYCNSFDSYEQSI